MEISQFELIYKPQSPEGPADIVLQGYFLNITNLEAVDLSFAVTLVTSSVTDADRTLAGNAIAIIDEPDDNNIRATISGAPSAKSFTVSRRVNVPAHGTSKIVILPSDPFAMPGGTPNFEARGVVRLTLPPRREIVGGPPFSLAFEPQIEGSARILVTPQNRATYLDATQTQVKSQTQASVPTVSGGALVEIPAQSSPFLAEFPVDVLDIYRGFARLDAASEPVSLLGLAHAIDALAQSGVDLKAVNARLKEIGIGMALEKRKL